MHQHFRRKIETKSLLLVPASVAILVAVLVSSVPDCFASPFSLNGGDFVPYPGSLTPTYDYSSLVTLSSGFVTDGFSLRTAYFTAQPSDSTAPVPEPSTFVLVGAGLAGAVLLLRKKGL